MKRRGRIVTGASIVAATLAAGSASVHELERTTYRVGESQRVEFNEPVASKYKECVMTHGAKIVIAKIFDASPTYYSNDTGAVNVQTTQKLRLLRQKLNHRIASTGDSYSAEHKLPAK